MKSAALITVLICCCTISLAESQQCSAPQGYWDKQRDDLSEYQLDRMPHVSSVSDCVLRAQSQHQAVAFSQADGTCRMFSCKLGWSGCRKCRNAVNSSLPLLMVRRLDQLGRTCWRTFQHRVDDSVDFYRNWTDYLSPFGQGEDRNYWMGLDAIHTLTQAADRRVRWETSMWNDSWWWWENQFFAVQGADQGYRVIVGDQDISRSSAAIRINQQAVSFMNNSKFSTPDRDQDSNSENCAKLFNGSWWYASCHCFNPNGQYYTPPTAYNLGHGNNSLWATGITVASNAAGSKYPFDQSYSMRTFECLFIDYAV